MEGDAGQMFGPVKAAVMAYANSLAQSVAPAIRVNTVAPGWIQTAWGESASEYWDTAGERPIADAAVGDGPKTWRPRSPLSPIPPTRS